MNRKTLINGEVVEVERSRIKAGDLLRLAGRNPDEYELQLRRGERGPVAKTYGTDEIIDLDSECVGAARGPGGPGGGEGGVQAPTNAGDGAARGPGGPGGGGAGDVTQGAPKGRPGSGAAATATDIKQDCYFTTRYTGPINPA